MFFVVKKAKLQRIISIVREDRTPKKQGHNAPFLLIKAAGNELTISGNKVSATFPATVYEPGVLFIRKTNFRRVLKATKIEGDFLTFQVTNKDLVFADVRYPFESLNMVLYPNPKNAPSTWPPAPPDAEQIPEKKQPTLFDFNDDESEPMDERGSCNTEAYDLSRRQRIQLLLQLEEEIRQNPTYRFHVDKSDFEQAFDSVSGDMRVCSTKVFEKTLEAAESGDCKAMWHLGCLYNYGKGVAEDHKKAATWLRLSADAGNSDAQYSLALLYSLGFGVERDSREALKCFEVAAEAGNSVAMTILGYAYKTGILFKTFKSNQINKVVNKSHEKALYWYQKAAELEMGDAIMSLAYMYAYGDGIPKNSEKASELYRRLAIAENSSAMLGLASLYEEEDGNYTKAAGWYLKAAEAGNTLGMYYIARFLEGGCGVAKNYESAMEWYRKAAQLGHRGAQEKLQELGELL